MHFQQQVGSRLCHVFSASHSPLVCVWKQQSPAPMGYPGHRIHTFLTKKEHLDMSEKSASPAIYRNNQCSCLTTAICQSTKLCAPAELEGWTGWPLQTRIILWLCGNFSAHRRNCSYREVLLILSLLQQNNRYCLTGQRQVFVKALNPNIYTAPVSTPASHPLISAHGKEKPWIFLHWEWVHKSKHLCLLWQLVRGELNSECKLCYLKWSQTTNSELQLGNLDFLKQNTSIVPVYDTMPVKLVITWQKGRDPSGPSSPTPELSQDASGITSLA